MNQILSKRRPAVAALLMILSASVVLADPKTVPFKGSFDERDTGVVQFPILSLTGGGSGTASQLGRFSFTSDVKVDLTNSLSSGTIQLLAANGDAINGVCVGRGEPTDTPHITHVILLVTITGGTGRFQGATGAFTMDSIRSRRPQHRNRFVLRHAEGHDQHPWLDQLMVRKETGAVPPCGSRFRSTRRATSTTSSRRLFRAATARSDPPGNRRETEGTIEQPRPPHHKATTPPNPREPARTAESPHRR